MEQSRSGSEVNNSNLAYTDSEATRAKDISYALDIVDLSKSFKRKTITKSGYSTLKSTFLKSLFKRNSSNGSFTHAIKDLTLRIPQGLSVGIIGRNGSGKSTLLKLITGIYKPDVGHVRVKGRVAALIELGAGFHPDFTGRENLYLGAVMHGLTKAEIDERFDEIVRFAELEGVIDDAVKTYSSGMFMRLGFSLAIHTDPDVLLVDEVLAVGDARFVSKCKEKIAELRRENKTLLLVTHDLDAVERWCDEALWLEAGKVKDRGDPRRVIDHYRQFIEKGEESELVEQQATKHETDEGIQAPQEKVNDLEARRWGSREIEIAAVKLKDRQGEDKLLFHPEDSVKVEIHYNVRQHTEEVVFGIGINRSDGLVVHGSNTDIEEVALNLSDKGVVSYHVKRLSLLEGNYTIDVAVHRKDGYPYDYHKNVVTFAVRSACRQVGVFEPEHSWESM